MPAERSIADPTPTRKVGAAALGGALGTVVVIVLKAVWPTLDVTGLEGAAAVLFGCVLSYWVPERDLRA